MDEYRELFPITRERIYLNHAALGPLSSRSVAALEACAREQALLADHATEARRVRHDAVRRKLAALIGAEPGEVATVKNTPEALSLVAAGLRWRPGDRVVTSDQEFPANIYPWRNLAERGVELHLVPSHEGRVPLEAVVDAIDDRTRLVALSWIEFSTGYRNDLQAIAAACRQRGTLLAVDAIQGIGAIRMDVRELGIDFLGFSSHKWLLGPLGVGWFYCRRELLDRLDLVMVGQGSVDQGSSWLDYDRELWPDARRFETGAPNALGLAGLEASLDLFDEIGTVGVEDRIKRLSDRLAAGLEERGYRLGVRRGPSDWSGVVTFTSERHTPAEIHARLDDGGVSTAVREGRVRVSPHFYNTPEEIDTLLATLPT